MSKQLHKNFTDEQVKLLLKSYMDKGIKINYILQILGIKRRRFFKLLARYKKDPDNFSIHYNRKTINRKIDPDIEQNILKELKIEKDLIKTKDAPIKYYNYSFIKDLLEQKYILNNFLKLFLPSSLLPRPSTRSLFSLVKNIKAG